MPRFMTRPTLRLISFVLAFSMTALVSGCQLALPGPGSKTAADVTANAVTGDAIEVTALDAAPDTEASPVPDGAFPQQADPPAAEGADAPQSGPAQGSTPELETEVAVAPEPPPPPPKSVQQLACEKKKGNWSPIGKGSLRTCVFVTGDAGKQCSRKSQCEGQCLARSGTCSPLRPLLGCNEILQENGARVTECVE